jgi:hypothetical protein
MAGENLQTIFNALSVFFDPMLMRQWNRTAVLAGLLAASPASKPQELGGKQVAFDVEFTGGTASTVAEGSDVAASEYASDVDEPFVLPWATYRSSFQVTEQEVDAARNSVGTADDLMDLFGARIMSAGALIASQIEQDMLTGTGVDANGNPTIIGVFGGAVSASGAYGGLNPATWTEWAGNVLANGGVLRTLTPDLLEQADANIFTGSSVPWNLAMTSAGVARKYAGMFYQGPATSTGTATNAPIVRMNDGGQYQLGQPTGSVNGAPAQQQGLFWKGQPVYRNRLNPTGKVALLNTDYIKVKYLPRTLRQADIDFMQMMQIEGSSGRQPGSITATGIPMRIAVLAKTGDSYKISCRTTLQMAITRRNAQAVVQDISEV